MIQNIKPLTKQQKFIIMAYTGVVTMPFSQFHEWAEKLLGCPIFTHQFASEEITKLLKEKSKVYFLIMCDEDK